MIQKHVFGPVPSRRLGFSLGIDIIKLKTCTYNCIYCQLYQTSVHTIIRQTFFDKQAILADIKEAVNKFDNIDYLTFSGSGEPTLSSDLGWLIKEVKSFTSIPVVVITNSSLLWMPDVREDIRIADVVMPSVDSVDPKIWAEVNRPAIGIEMEKVLEGIKTFCKQFKGKIWLEVMLVNGVNDSLEEIMKTATFVNSLENIDAVQINTVVRPPNEASAKPLTPEQLNDVLKYYKYPAEIIASFKKGSNKSYIEDKSEAIIDLLTRRPCTPEEMADSLGINLNEISKHLQHLTDGNKVERQPSGHYISL